jgi:hypothetical protein
MKLYIFDQQHLTYLFSFHGFQEHGIIEHLRAEYEIKSGAMDAKFSAMSYDPVARARREAEEVSLSLGGHLYGAFLLLLSGLGLAFVVFLGELLWARHKLRAGLAIDSVNDEEGDEKGFNSSTEAVRLPTKVVFVKSENSSTVAETP